MPSQPIKVVHICNLPLTPDHPEFGQLTLHPGRWVLNLAKAQQAHADLQPHLVVQIPGSKFNFSTTYEGIPIHYVSAPDYLRSATFFHFDVKRLSRHVRALQPDIVHAHGTEDANLLAAQACGKPYLVSLQGCYFILNREMPPPLINRARVVEFTERRSLRKSKFAIAKSEYIAREVIQAFPHLKIRQIPNTFDDQLLELPTDQIRAAGSIAFVGTISERKGVHLITAALQILRSKHGEASPVKMFHIFGNRPEPVPPYEAEQKARLSEMLGDKVIFHGTIPALEVAQALGKIDLLLAPSLEEMFGNQIIESLLVGTPVIVTEGTAMADNVRRFGGGDIVPQKNPTALAEAIGSFFQKPFIEVSSQRESCRSRIQAFMGPEVVARAHSELYQEILLET